MRLLSGFRVEARNDKNASPRTSMRGPEENKRDIHLQGLCRYLPHAVFPPLCGLSPLRVFPGFRVEARNDKSVTPHTMRGPEEDKRDFHLQGLCRYLPHAVFSLCGYSLDSASGRGMTRTRRPAPRCGVQKRHSFTGSLPVFTSCGIPTLRLLSGFRVGAQNDKNASPRTRCGVQKRTNETFIYRVFAGIYLMRYSHFAATLWIPRRSAE